ncbi:MAG: type II toxin-antitoxin system VapC family toxin [Cyclobacteriaceae bacterium]|nr:type II toxin-antitoxin system VapC family toxin [Cyclobacteriaceae bacterium]
MGKGYLIDTNVIIDFSANRIPAPGKKLLSDCLDNAPVISVIMKIELLGFPIVTSAITDLVKSSLIIGLTDEIVEKTIQIRKQYKVKLPDAIIAATSIVSDLTLLSRNSSDFKKIKVLNYLDLFQL